jgi:D-aminopeptidase
MELLEQLRTGGSVDGAVDATTATQRLVRRIDDGVDTQRCYVSTDYGDHTRKVEIGMRRGKNLRRLAWLSGALVLVVTESAIGQTARARARELGVAPGIFSPGPRNAITDVADVTVGQVTIIEGDSVRTGVTAILPHGGNLYRERVPAALYVGNGFGKLLGVTQLRELGELETPILLTCTLCVWKAADAMVEWLLERPGMEQVRSINPVVGETNDGTLNAIRSRPVRPEHVRKALESAGASVDEGSVGAGAGTVAFGWKGGIGTSSRVLPQSLGGWTVGVLVQSNFGGILQVMGAPVGKELGRYSFQRDVTGSGDRGDGSIMMVIATNAPLSDRNLERLAKRSMMGLARTGSFASNGSGDYAIAFSTSPAVRRPFDAKRLSPQELANEEMSGLFEGVVEATEEAIYNSLFRATTVTGNGRTIDALPLDRVREILQRYNVAKR